MKQIRTLLLLFLVGMVLACPAQNDNSGISAQEKKQVIDSISTILESSYVFPEVALKMTDFLKIQLQDNKYDGIKDAQEFAQKLTEDIQSVSKDLHLRVRFDPEGIARRRNAELSAEDSVALAERRLRNNRRSNYGFREAKILDGNIGYLNLTGFFGVSEEAGAAAAATMNFLSNTDALIIDLRRNGGGSPAMIQLITSYLYGPEPVHLNNFYNRADDEQTQTWTLPYVPGKRRPDVPVYVLTSSSTFSAAEEFSYNLRNQERATLIGEVTGGGAHPGGTQIATERFAIFVPDGRAINPITQTNWEGTGVEPHIKVSAKDALETAKLKALEMLLKKNEGKEGAFFLKWAMEGIQSQMEPVTVDQKILKSYAGDYGPRKIHYKEGALYYQREGNTEYQLIPMSQNKFRIVEVPAFRIEMLKENGKVTGLKGLYDSGRTDQNARTGK
ncbi:S41 family peptidase [Ulvibacterium marinum]|uniref:S41 family peptidase n=1 Tax=Ulvibacterium marinum TaxID=2419782 RepID=UPI0024955127|nr:S41 family peptidase [Ulvibacterium marinum]